MALSLGAEGISVLQPGEWQGFVSYRWLYADEGYIGGRVDPTYKSIIGARIDIHSFDVTAVYSFTERLSASLTFPFSYGEVSTLRDHDGIHRHSMSAGGLGDIRLVGNAWLLDPQKHSEGNVALSLGFKAPSGDDRAADIAYRPTGPELRPVDSAIQPGDGGWGAVIELQAFQKLFRKTYAYVQGFYLINPREMNHTQTGNPLFGPVVFNSVPDQYLGRVGISYDLWPEKGLSFTLGGRIDGIPMRDLIGGSDGFRRPGYGIYIEPGFILNRNKNSFSLSTPVAVDRNRERSVLDARNHVHGPGAFADFLVLASYSRRF